MTYPKQTPYYIIHEDKLKENVEALQYVKQETGCKILLATKAYSCFATYPLIASYLDGTTNSSLNETRLSKETFGKETHVYSPAYSAHEFPKIAAIADQIVFNSLQQFKRFKNQCRPTTQIGLRLNPEHVEVTNKLYSPCVPGSRFGVRAQDLAESNLDQISGFHIHALCQNNDESLVRLMAATEDKFATYLAEDTIRWINFGGGHMIPQEGYNSTQLCNAINAFQNKYNVQIILEPGEAVVYQAGELVASVLDIVHNKLAIAILDTSATAHMPDVLEMPYRPNVTGAAMPGNAPYTYRLGGNTCLSGDVIGEYSFDQPLSIGDKLIFEDMAQYTMVKNTTFNGINLPDIYVKRLNGAIECVAEFNYDTFKSRV